MLYKKRVVNRYFKEEILALTIAEGDTIADVGASAATYEGMISLYNDYSLYYIVDINAGCLSEERIAATVNWYNKIKKEPSHNRLVPVHNSSDSIPLRANLVDKVLIRLTLHEMSNRRAILEECRRVLKEDGQLIIIEPRILKEGTIHPGCGITLLTEEEINDAVIQVGFVPFRRVWCKNNSIVLSYRKSAY